MKRMLCMAFAALTILDFSACGLRTTDAFLRFCRETELDLDQAEILSDQDSHGGFHGDGTRLVKVKFHWDTKRSSGSDLCPYDRARKAMEEWGEPSGELLSLLCGEETPDGRSYSILPCDEDMEPIPFPRAGGYFYLEDRYPQDSPGADRDILTRGAYNLTVAVYDLDTDILYYCEVDT